MAMLTADDGGRSSARARGWERVATGLDAIERAAGYQIRFTQKGRAETLGRACGRDRGSGLCRRAAGWMRVSAPLARSAFRNRVCGAGVVGTGYYAKSSRQA